MGLHEAPVRPDRAGFGTWRAASAQKLWVSERQEGKPAARTGLPSLL